MKRIKHLLSTSDNIDFLMKLVWVKIHKFLFYIRYRGRKINQKQVLFECFEGKFINDSPLAIYQQFVELKIDIEAVWVIKNSKQKALLSSSTQDLKTTYVEYGSNKYFEAYATSAHWIVNCRTPFNVYKRKAQRLVQCWHGTPLKKMGHDIAKGNNPNTSLKGLKFAYSVEASKVDYFISPSKYASDCFCSSFALNRDKILEVGYPRNDQLIESKQQNGQINSIKTKLGIELGKQVILYAPTWRDNRYSKERQSHTLPNPLDSKVFTSTLSDYVFLYRGHYFTKPESEMDNFIDFSEHDNLNELLLVSDLLITDYSSIFFDFQNLDREVIFYMPDMDEYLNESRGFYLNIEQDLPGIIAKDIPELMHAITSSRPDQARNLKFNSRFNPYEDGNSALRVIKRLGFY